MKVATIIALWILAPGLMSPSESWCAGAAQAALTDTVFSG